MPAFCRPISPSSPLAQLKATADNAFADFEYTLAHAFPGATQWHWHRAVGRMEGQNCARNEGQSRDEDMAAHEGVKAAWDAYMVALHRYYALLRDGPRGVLGSRGL